MWEALGLLLLLRQEQGGGWAQICSPADAAGCHTQRAHTRSPLTQTLHKYRHRVALILRTQMPNTSHTLFSAGNGNTACLSKLNTSQLPVIASSLISGKSLKTCSAMRSVCCEVTWHLWAGEDDVVYLESLLCGGEVVSAGEGDQKKTNKNTLVTSGKAGRSCSQQIQIFTLTFRHFFFFCKLRNFKNNLDRGGDTAG